MGNNDWVSQQAPVSCDAFRSDLEVNDELALVWMQLLLFGCSNSHCNCLCSFTAGFYSVVSVSLLALSHVLCFSSFTFVFTSLLLRFGRQIYYV